MYSRFIAQEAELIVDYLKLGGKDGMFIALHANTISQLANAMPEELRKRDQLGASDNALSNLAAMFECSSAPMNR